jgi:molybdopterin molybdotransferase
MPTFAEARTLILENVSTLGSESVEILDALDRVIVEDVFAPENMPSYDSSAMDGYAVRESDCRELPAKLRLIGYIPAGGEANTAVEPGCAVKIMTGAPLPANCDAIVPIEETAEADGCVLIKAKVKPRQHMRFTGEDVKRGEVVIPSGTVIHPPEISMLATCNRVSISVYRRPRVAILSTGDELIELGEALGTGKVINSNAYSLAASIKEIGAIPAFLGIARDNRDSHREKMTEGLRADAMITSAGVSTGDRDLVREVLSELGAKELFWKVDVKPGGPMAFLLKDGKPLFCLPGNPVATMITFEEFVRPALSKMLGRKRVFRKIVRAVFQGEIRNRPGKIKFVRVRLEDHDGNIFAYSAGDQNTGMLKAMLNADGLAMIPADRALLSTGDLVDVHVLSSELGMQES